MVRDRFPAPLIENVLDFLQDAKVFSTIDLKNGFFHVPVEKTILIIGDSRWPISLHEGTVRMQQSPSAFHRFVNEAFKDLINKGIMMAYMDDIVIPAKNEREAIDKLKIVFKRASEAGVEINWKKCQFLQNKIEFLGHVIEDGCLKPFILKTEAVRKFKEPTTIKQVQSFLGLTGYFRKFIEGYSSIAKPLSDLTRKKNKLIFGINQKVAFEILKKKLCEDPVLRIFRDDAETQLHTDASRY